MLPKIPHVKPGDVLTDELYNAIADRLERCANLSVAYNSGLILEESPDGRTLALCAPTDIWAILSGSSSPYSWTQAEPQSSGTWASFGQLSGTANAYEINGIASLGGKTVRLSETPAGDWRFAYEGQGFPAPVGCTFCLNVSDICTAAHITPSTAVLKTGSTVVATATIGNQLVSVAVTGGGSGYSNGWWPLGISGGGGAGAAGEFFVSGGHVTSVSLTANGSGYTSSPTITFPGAGGSGATGTATVNNTACFQGISNGTYTLVVTATGYLDFSTSLVLGTCNTKTVQMTPATVTLSGTNVLGCPNTGFGSPDRSGIVVTGVQGASSQSTTTDASGDFTFGSPFASNASIVLTFHDPDGRFSDHSYTYTISNPCIAQTTNAGSNGVFSLFPGSDGGLCPDGGDIVTGDACDCISSCFYPINKTIHVTESSQGITGTLTFSCTTRSWRGTLSMPVAGCAGNDGNPYTCPAGTATVDVVFGFTSIGGTCVISVQWHSVDATGPSLTGIKCPLDGGTLAGAVGLSLTSIACPPAFSVVATMGGTVPPCGGNNPFTTGTTFTFTE